MSLDEIVDSLHDRFRLLTGGARTAVRRQQTLRASVDWSHALLTEPERILFRRLAVFLGGFDLDAAQAVAGDGEVERYQVLDQLALLVDKSLVVAENTGGRTRYRLLETVRQYALEKLGESGEADAVRSRHRDHYTAMAALLDAPAQQRSRAAHRAGRRARWTICEAHSRGAVETGDTERALQLASSLQPLWLSRGRIQEGLAWLEAALADDSAQIPPAMRVRAYTDNTMLLASLALTGGVDEAELALTTARELDNPALLIRALVARGSVSSYDVQVSRRYFAEAAALARELDDSWWLSQILFRQAGSEMVTGEVAAGRSTAEEGRRLADAIGDRWASRVFSWSQGWAQSWQGDLAGAVARFTEAIDEATEAQDAMTLLYCLVMQGFALALMGDSSRALAAADAAIDSYPEFFEIYEGPAHSTRGYACLAAGDIEAARQEYEQARQRPGPRASAGTNCWAALAPLACGDLTAARRWADDVVSVATGCYLSAALTTRARVEIAQGEIELAARDSYEALGIAVKTGSHLVVPDVLECLADVAAHEESHREAVRLLGAADAHRQRTGAVRFNVLAADFEAAVERFRNALGGSEFEAAWAEGTALSTEEAITYAQRGRGERKRPSSGWASLTPTECDVVELLREGLSNKDIATRLFVSPRTVQSHLTHVYTKLGLTSRVQLAQEAARHAGVQLS